MGATLDGIVAGSGAVFEAKFMLPWSFSEEAAAEKHMAQLQHNMWVTNSRLAALSVITGGGKWVEISISADPLYQHLLLTAGKKFWRCVESGEPPRLFGVEPPRPRIEAIRIVDMSCSRARLAAKRAMNSPSRSADRTTARCIAPATRKLGGSKPASTRSTSPASSGNTPAWTRGGLRLNRRRKLLLPIELQNLMMMMMLLLQDLAPIP